jgi:polyphosphate kinase 2 (PPK2 family)
VERVENLASAPEWKRAYAEINDFEEQLVEHGMVLVKYWLHISSDEQLARFKAREETPHKRWKITDEDWRNRERWADYDRAVNDMVQQTSTLHSPWTLVEGNDKRFARVKVIRTLCAQLEGALRKV